MTKQIINIGSSPNDGTGDGGRTAFSKSNSNFTELYNGVPALSVLNYGVIGDGITDDTAALNTALQAGAGGTVVIPRGLRILVNSADITIPDRTSLVGPHISPGGIEPHTTAQLALVTGVILLNSAYSIKICTDNSSGTSGGAISGLYIIRSTLTTLPTNPSEATTAVAAFAGTAIKIGNGLGGGVGRDVYVGHCSILGFAQGIYADHCDRYLIEQVRGDCTAGIYTTSCFDIGRIEQCHFTGLVTKGSGGGANRSGVGFYFDTGNDWSQIQNCFCYGNDIGFKVNANSVRLIGCGADGDSSSIATTSKGFSVEGSSIDTMLIGCEASSHGINFNITSTGVTTIIGASTWGSGSAGFGVQNHFYFNNGTVTLNESNLYGTPFVGGVSIDTSISSYNIANSTFDVGASKALVTYAGNSYFAGTFAPTNTIISGVNATSTFHTATQVTATFDNRTSAGAAGAPQIGLGHANGSAASPTILASGDPMGAVRFNGYDGAALQIGASVRAQADGAPGANSMPGRIIMGTTKSGATSITDAWAVDTTQNFRPIVTGATNLTGGFSYIQAAAGAPSGTPTFTTNGVPVYWDSTNLQLYVYTGGAWKKSAVFT